MAWTAPFFLFGKPAVPQATSWARATKDKAYAAQFRLRAANELEQAEQAREAIADLNPLLAEFNVKCPRTISRLSWWPLN